MTTEGQIDGLPVRVPILAIHTVGAGGGSIAALDAGGALIVGPRNAGAVPGPACYGRGGNLPTVTDAHVALGRLPADHFLGGRMRLDVAAAESVCRSLAEQLDASVDEAAFGILQVANVQMERALRVISVEKGYDPSDFTLVSFGGAGGLHACDLARGLGIPRVLVPAHPGVLSAWGMAVADVVKTYSQGILGIVDDPLCTRSRRCPRSARCPSRARFATCRCRFNRDRAVSGRRPALRRAIFRVAHFSTGATGHGRCAASANSAGRRRVSGGLPCGSRAGLRPSVR